MKLLLCVVLIAGVSFVKPSPEPLHGVWEAVEFEDDDGHAPDRMCLTFLEDGRYTLVVHGQDDAFVSSMTSGYAVEGDRITMDLQPPFQQSATVSFESTRLVLNFDIDEELEMVVRFRRPVADLQWCTRFLEPEE